MEDEAGDRLIGRRTLPIVAGRRPAMVMAAGAALLFVPASLLLPWKDGYAWSYDRFSRTQLAGTPAGGTAGPGTGDAMHALRSGLALGAGIEAPVAANWTATLQYLVTAFGSEGASFPAAGADKADVEHGGRVHDKMRD